MGPKCPHCYALYEWTESEITEDVYSPKVYFCQGCMQLFTLTSEEITDLQEHFRPQMIDNKSKSDEDLFKDLFSSDD